MLLGIPLALTSRAGAWPKRNASDLRRPLLTIVLVAAVTATVAALVGWFFASQGWVFLLPPMSQRVPEDRHIAFITDLWAHSASYLIGFLGGLALIAHTLRWRWRASREA